MKRRTIKEIKELLLTIQDENHPELEVIIRDERKGVKQALSSWKKRIESSKKLLADYERMSEFEKQMSKKGYELIAGIDEVGRGPLAGPVVAAAVILPVDHQILGLNDSKQLSLRKREQLFEEINSHAVSIGIGIVDSSEIDRINIYQASKKAMKEAVNSLDEVPHALLVDAMEINSPLPQEKIIKGDSRSVSIAAASIIAKITRDKIMQEYDQLYPGYGFSSNAGYGTKDHLEGLKKLGATPIHRRSFSPVKNIL